MSRTDALHERITRLFAEGLHVTIPSTDTDLFESGVLDSIGFVELLVQLEREFGIATGVDDLEVSNFKSIARIADYVSARAAAGSGASATPIDPTA